MKVFFSLLLLIPGLLYATKPGKPIPSTDCVIDLGPDLVVCANAHFTLNPHPLTPGDYIWTGDAGLDCYNCPSPVVSDLTAGIYTYVATVTTPDCTASDTIKITVLNAPAPQYEIAQSQGICAGDSINIGGASFPGTNYFWYSAPPGYSSFIADPKVRPAGPVTYYLLASNTSCPIPTLDSVTITPTALALQLNPMDTVRLCKGKAQLLQATVNPAGVPLQWSPVTGLQVNAGGLSATARPSEGTLYTVTASLGGCTRTRGIYIAVDSLPADLDIRPSDTTVCQGAKVFLISTVYEPAEYPKMAFKWTPLAGALTPDSLYNLVVQPDQTTIYRRITRNGACSDTAFAVVKVIPPAEMNATPATSLICPGESVLLRVSYTPGVTNVTWTPSTGLSCTKCDSTIATPGATQQYTVSGDYQGCQVQTTAIVNVRPLAPLKFPSDVQLCAGEPVTLNQLFDPTAKYTWTSTHPGFGTVVQPDPTFTPTQTATYYVTADNGCIRKDSVKIFVSTAVLTVDGDTTICKNFTAPLFASANVFGTYQWRNDLTGQVIDTKAVTSVNPSETTTYTVVFSYGDNCQLSKQVKVTINGEAPEITVPADLKICPGEILKLNTAPALPGAVYTWIASPPDATLATNASNPQVSPTVNTTYSVTAKLGNCSNSRQINVQAFSATLTVTPDTTICDSTLLTLKAAGSDPSGTYLWSTGSKSPTITDIPSGDKVYTVTFTYGDGCTIVKTIDVSVVDNFTLSVQSVPKKDTLDVGAQVTLTASVSPPQNLSKFKFIWQEITIDTKPLASNKESVDIVVSSNDTSARTITYRVIATSPSGCVQVFDKTFVLVFPMVRFPNAFTPDNDGHNDDFRMVLLQGLAVVDRMEIYNRWGELVYESTDPAAAWDGKVNGENAPSDVYIYRVWWRRGDGALQVQSKGDVTLLR